MAEVTHNETADPSMNFPQPEHNSPDEQPSSRDPRAPASFSNDDLSESERSLDFFRAKDAATSVMTPPASHESFSLLITSQDHVHQSVLLSPLKDMEATAPSLSKLATCSDAPVANTTQPQEPVSSGSVEKLTSEEEADMQDAEELLHPQDSAGEKGILEQSQITLVSLTDTSLQDQDATLTDEAGSWGDEHPDVVKEEAQTGQDRCSVCVNLFVLFLSTFFPPSRRQNQCYQLNPTTTVEPFQVKRHSSTAETGETCF